MAGYTCQEVTKRFAHDFIDQSCLSIVKQAHDRSQYLLTFIGLSEKIPLNIFIFIFPCSGEQQRTRHCVLCPHRQVRYGLFEIERRVRLYRKRPANLDADESRYYVSWLIELRGNNLNETSTFLGIRIL